MTVLAPDHPLCDGIVGLGVAWGLVPRFGPRTTRLGSWGGLYMMHNRYRLASWKPAGYLYMLIARRNVSAGLLSRCLGVSQQSSPHASWCGCHALGDIARPWTGGS
jgi:hypothetical protein